MSAGTGIEPAATTKGIGWCLEPWKKYASFTGRARRKEYWSFFLLNWIVTFAISFIGSAAGQDYSALVGIYYIAALLPSIAVGVRRMHDTDHNGWWLLFPLVNLAFALTDGDPRANRFGPDPKGRGRQGEVAGRATSKVGVAIAVFAVVFAVVGILAAIAVPGLLRARMAGNEASAIGALRAINGAQAAYASDCGHGGFAQSLDDLAKPPAGSAQAFVAADLSSNNIVKNGYVVTVTAGREAFPVTSSASTCNGAAADSVSEYFAEAHPVTIGTTGQRSFATDSRGVIYSNDSGMPIPMGMPGTRALQ